MKIFSLLLLFCTACSGQADIDLDDTGECAYNRGRLWGQIADEYGSAIVKVTPEGGEAINVSTDLLGVYEVELAPGNYAVGAADDIGGCFTEEDLPVTIVACGSHEVNPVMTECFGR